MGTRRIRRPDGEFTLFFRKVSPFSNHHPADFICEQAINCCDEPRKFSCTEQYYMFNKASLLRDENLMTAVLMSDSPRKMKSMCSKGNLNNWSDATWDQHKEHVMYTGCLAKFRSCRHLRFALFLSTGSRLVECSPFDTVWGIGKDLEGAMEAKTLDTGKNLLGKILERVREKLWEEEVYRDERENVEKRMKEDADYALKAMKQVDLLYKQRAIERFQAAKRGSIPANRLFIVTNHIPEWGMPPELGLDEAIRPSPAQITHFPSSPVPVRRHRSATPPLPEKGNQLFGRLTISERRPVEQKKRSRSSSRDTFETARSRSRSEERQRKRRRMDSGTSRRHRSRSRSPRDRRERREAERRKSERRSERRSTSHKKSHRHHRHRSSDSEREKRHRKHSSDSERGKRHRKHSGSHKSSRKSESREKSRSRKKEHRHRRRRTSSTESRNSIKSQSPACVVEL